MARGRRAAILTVGPSVGSELIRTSIVLIVIGELFILGYLWVRFGFRYGTAAIVALLHDVIVVVGIFAMLGYFFGLEFDALFVTALLTIIGFSVHDTIVVFDRIRENRVRHAGEPFGAIVNHSILQTLGRSINTQPDGGGDADRPPAARSGHDPNLHPGAADRRRQRDLLVDLQRQPAARGLVRVGLEPQGEGACRGSKGQARRSLTPADNGPIRPR